jgi:hypothetical protein
VIVRCYALGAIVAAALTACGGTSSAPTEAPGETGTHSTIQTAPENPLPPELQGTWLLKSADPVRLYLRETSYTVSTGGSHAGQVEAEGSVLKFTSLCGTSFVEGVGRYRWSLNGDALHFDLLGEDECTGRSAVLEDATHERKG